MKIIVIFQVKFKVDHWLGEPGAFLNDTWLEGEGLLIDLVNGPPPIDWSHAKVSDMIGTNGQCK